MKQFYLFSILAVTLYLIGMFVYLCYQLYRSKTKISPFAFSLLGMFVGGLSGFLAFFNLDRSKGWNPYGWWFIASFFAAILGGFVAMLIYGTITNKRPKV